MATAVAAAPSRLTRLRRWEGLPYWLILPTVAYLAIFFAWPMIQAFELAFREGGTWTFAPYRTMYNDINFGIAIRFTLVFIALIIPIQFVLALIMALVANSDIRGRTVFLFIFVLPLGASDLATGLIWSSVFTQHGYLNSALTDLGLMSHPYIWLDPNHQFLLTVEVMVAEIWRSTALITVILIAGMQGIPREYDEAADVFGASFFQRVWHVTIPMLKPAIRVAILLRIIFAFEVFGTVLAIAGSSTTTLAAQAYNWETALQNPHVAAAYASVILALSLGAAAIVLRLLRTPHEQVAR